MTTFTPRPPYSEEELDKLYPKNLELQLVQVILRHGERAPVSARFQNAGLAPYWPYCNGSHAPPAGPTRTQADISSQPPNALPPSQ